MKTSYPPALREVIELSKIKSCFIASVRQTLSNLGSGDAIKVRAHLIEVIGSYTAPYLFSPDNLMDVSGKVFGDEAFRDWLLSTRFVFFTELAALYGESMVEFVVDNLARNASLDMGAADFLDKEQAQEVEGVVEVPLQVRQELMPYRAAKVALAANTWLIVILLALAFIHLDNDVLVTPVPDKNIPRNPS